MIKYRTDAVKNAVDGAPCAATTRTAKCDFVATTSLQILALVASGMSKDMNALKRAGPVPAEVASLIDDTIAKADAAATTTKALADCGQYPTKCDNIQARWNIDDLMRVIDQWAPFGVR